MLLKGLNAGFDKLITATFLFSVSLRHSKELVLLKNISAMRVGATCDDIDFVVALFIFSWFVKVAIPNSFCWWVYWKIVIFQKINF